MGGLYADEDNVESCPDHHLHKVFVVGQFYGRLRIEGEGILFPLHPFNDGGEDLLLQLLVADKVVVNKGGR